MNKIEEIFEWIERKSINTQHTKDYKNVMNKNNYNNYVDNVSRHEWIVSDRDKPNTIHMKKRTMKNIVWMCVHVCKDSIEKQQQKYKITQTYNQKITSKNKFTRIYWRNGISFKFHLNACVCRYVCVHEYVWVWVLCKCANYNNRRRAY